MTDDEWEQLKTFSLWWAEQQLPKFKHWAYHELVNEVIVGYFAIRHRHDPSRGSINSFLKASIWDVVYRSYAEQRDIQITRLGQKRGKSVPRKYTQRLYFTDELPESTYEYEDEPDTVLPEIPQEYREITDLLQRGLTQRQVACSLGVTESRISQRMRELRKELNGENN